MIFSHNWEGEPHNSPSVKRLMRPEDPYYTHEWMGEPHNSPSIRREVWPGDPEYTYAWEGEAGMSPSLKYRDGELVSKNISNAPAKINDEYSMVAVEYVQEQFTHMSMIETQEGNTPYVGLTRMVVTPGDYFASGVDFRWGEGVGRVRHQIQFRGPDNESISAPQIQRDFSDWPEGGRSIFVERVPDGATEARIYTWFYIEGNFTPAPAGSTIRVGGYVNATGSTEEEAHLQVEEPFDGYSNQHRGRIVATNLVPNPASRNIDDYHYTTNTFAEFRDRGDLFPELNGRIDGQAFYFEAIDSTEGSVYASQTVQNSVSLIKGYWYAASVWVHTIEDGSLTQPYRFNIQFRDSVMYLWSSRLAETYSSGMHRIEISGYVDVDDATTWWVFWPSDLRRAIGKGVYVAATTISGPSHSEEEAIEQVKYFFDGDSPSEYGEVVAKNLVVNPSFELSTSKGVSLGTGISNHYRTQQFPVSGQYEGCFMVESATNTNATISQEVGRVKKDKYVALKMHVQSNNTTNRFRLRITFNYGNGWNWHSTPYMYLPPTLDNDGVVFVTQAADDADSNVYLQIHSDEGESEPLDGWVRTDAWRIAVADTEEEALRQVEHYFDGDTRDYALAKPKIWLSNRWVPFTPTHFL